MPDQPLSVVIVTHNSHHEIDGCLTSLFADSASRPVQVIVVDNASTDGTPAHIAAHWPQVTLLTQASNRGFATANNFGLSAATDNPVVLLNPDTVVHPGALTALLAALTTHPDVGIVGPRLLNADGSLQPSCRAFPSLLGDLVGMTELYRLAVVDRLVGGGAASRNAHRRAHRADWLSGACLLVRRAAADAAGPLDEGFFMYSEEMEWQYRMAQRGWARWYEPAACITHLGGASTSAVPGERIVWQYQSIFRFYNCYRSAAHRLALRLLVWAVTWPKIVILALLSGGNRHRRDILRAFWQVLWLR